MEACLFLFENLLTINFPKAIYVENRNFENYLSKKDICARYGFEEVRKGREK